MRRPHAALLLLSLASLTLDASGCNSGDSEVSGSEQPQYTGKYELVPGSVSYWPDNFRGELKPSSTLVVKQRMEHVNNELFEHWLSLDFNTALPGQMAGRFTVELDVVANLHPKTSPLVNDGVYGWAYDVENSVVYGGIACYSYYRYSLYLMATPNHKILNTMFELTTVSNGQDPLTGKEIKDFVSSRSFEEQFALRESSANTWNAQLEQTPTGQTELHFRVMREKISMVDGTGSPDGCALPQDGYTGPAEMHMVYRATDQSELANLLEDLDDEVELPKRTILARDFFSRLVSRVEY